MRKTYENIVLPNLDKIKRWVEKGAQDREIANKLGIGYSTFRRWVTASDKDPNDKKELGELYARAREIPDGEVEASLYKLANGYTAKVQKIVKLRHVEYDPDTGKKMKEWETIEHAPEEVHVQANVNAQMFYLANRLPDKWKYQGKLDGDRNGKESKEGEGGVIILPDVKDAQSAANEATEAI